MSTMTMTFKAKDASIVKQIGKPAEIAKAYLFLMRSGFVTGQVVVVVGGMLLV
jgi:NAD(P)-dependent dehydrogenase (short-subunit alcohol dehydrogenase family)